MKNTAFSKYAYAIIIFAGILTLLILVLFNNQPFSIISEENNNYLRNELSAEERAEDLIRKMSLSEKLWQMILVERRSIKNPMDIAAYSIWWILNWSWDYPEPNTPLSWIKMVEAFQSHSQKSRLKIPLLYWVDTIHGHTNLNWATVFPHAIWLGATRDVELVKRIGKATAEEMMSTDIFWWFSPWIDIALDNRWWRFYESFGSDESLVWEMWAAYISWFQSISEDGSRAMATAKHYVWNGSMSWWGSWLDNYPMDKWSSEISEEELRKIHIEPFKKAIRADVWAIMIWLNEWRWIRVTWNKYLITDVLKEELWFKGLVVTDWYWAYEIDKDNYKSIVKAINAWVDMIMLPYDYKAYIAQAKYAIWNWEITEDRINDAVKRILIKKFELGLFDKKPSYKNNLQTIWSEEHRNIAREAVRKSIVLMKNNDAVLPMPKNVSRINISWSIADNLWKQSWGWTINWQGISWNHFPWTTILKWIRDAVWMNTEVQFSENWEFRNPAVADIGIAIVWEETYAEWVWDNPHPALSESDISVIRKTKVSSKKLIVIIVSGRPLDINEFQDDWGTIVAVWLPWSEGQWVADVLFWDYPFTGQLPVKWDLK
ncbi:MAG: Beta-N-acetylhexosaminidase [uncultured bacterium (gcode 4)]|uniref:beta-glucosidase n=1 Tax=uncultured bacterium (gcode 4) TaxID=1234023 RepID=K2H0Z1_9BACT|nr:MAG: Beta-N-acetylhexosaminidase [uncultured bacterium (gcode 4)]